MMAIYGSSVAKRMVTRYFFTEPKNINETHSLTLKTRSSKHASVYGV